MTKVITKRKRVGRYSDTIRAQAGLEYAICGSFAQVGRSLNIPKNTLSQWNTKGIWDELIDRVRTEKSQEHIAKYNQMVDLAQTKAIELIPDITSAREATLVACMSEDKGLLLQGKPTSITSTSKSMQSMIDRFEKIEHDHQQIKGSVVAVQEKK